MDHAKLFQVLLNSVDSTVDVAALIENGVGVALAKAAGVVGKGSHLDATYPSSHVSMWWKRTTL